ncbi:MAG: mechanosensitive ion channel domain-containing protein [Candidatus Bathyarchaeia archaeon]|jgi:small-conductance mechanosensitive channel
MAHVIRSIKRLAVFLAFIVILSIGTLYAFDLFVAAPINLPMFTVQAFRIMIILAFWLAAIIIIRRSKPLMIQRIGNQAATVLQYVVLTITILIMAFGILKILGVSATELLTGAGIISITAGLVISTFVGSILSGFLVFTTYQFKVGDTVMVNNIPGKVTEMTALVMRIQTDVGQVSIPNSAIASGGIIITAVRKYEEPLKGGRLHYAVGDRVITSFMNEQGIVKELTLLQTVVHLDSGKEIIFQNNSVLAGVVSIAKITQAPNQTENKTA